MLSIVIPTLNEGKYIGKCLYQIGLLDIPEKEVIVVDCESTDDTVAVAESYGAQVVRYRKEHIQYNYSGAQRNLGASVARNEHILFLDADTYLYASHLKPVLDKFAQSDCGIATGRIVHDSKKLRYRFVDLGYYLFMRLLKAHPVVPGAFVLVKKTVHESVGGYNEHMSIGEDHEYGYRMGKASGLCRYFEYSYYTSVRRFEEQGYFNTLCTWIFYAGLYALKGPSSGSPLPYSYGKH